jgi:hypothetical protein
MGPEGSCNNLAILEAVTALHVKGRRVVPIRLSVMTLNAEFLLHGIDPEKGQVSFVWKGERTVAYVPVSVGLLPMASSLPWIVAGCHDPAFRGEEEESVCS